MCGKANEKNVCDSSGLRVCDRHRHNEKGEEISCAGVPQVHIVERFVDSLVRSSGPLVRSTDTFPVLSRGFGLLFWFL